MKKTLSFVLLVLIAGCATTTSQKPTPAQSPSASAPSTSTPAPSSAEAAPECVMMHATTEPEGLKEEGRWLHEHYPGWKKVSQGVSPGERVYDHLEIVTPSGEKHAVCFDITSFFGKF
jgi:hypothetical protein